MQPLHPILLKVPTSLNSKQIFLGFSKMPKVWKQEDIPRLYTQRKDTYAFLFLLINTLKSISTQQEHSECAQIIKQGAIFSLKSGFFCLVGFTNTAKVRVMKKAMYMRIIMDCSIKALAHLPINYEMFSENW